VSLLAVMSTIDLRVMIYLSRAAVKDAFAPGK